MIIIIPRIEFFDDIIAKEAMAMDIKNLTTFISVAEQNSFTRAAETLGYSQSTVSFQIRQLEAELGAPLFERVGRTISLTERGREVLKYAHQVSRLTQELQDSIQEGENLQGCVRMAMAESLCAVFSGESFRRFHAQYPGLSLKIFAAGTGDMLQLVNRNEADLIVTLDSHIYNTEYVIFREEKVGVHFVAGYGFFSEGTAAVPLTELVRRPFILTEKGMSYRRLMDEKLAELSLEIQPVLEIGNTDRICSLLEQNPMVSFLPDYVTDHAVNEGRLTRLHIEGFEVDVWKQLLYHRNKWISPQMKAVMQHCVENMFSSALSCR